MRKFERRQVTASYPVAIVCDVCSKEFDCDIDWQEAQEFHSIQFEAGYGSIFGDQNHVECDICQHCLKQLLGKYLRINDVREGVVESPQ